MVPPLRFSRLSGLLVGLASGGALSFLSLQLAGGGHGSPSALFCTFPLLPVLWFRGGFHLALGCAPVLWGLHGALPWLAPWGRTAVRGALILHGLLGLPLVATLGTSLFRREPLPGLGLWLTWQVVYWGALVILWKLSGRAQEGLPG